MSKPVVLVSMTSQEMVKIISENVRGFYARDIVKQKYQEYFDKLYLEVKEEIISSNGGLRDESENEYFRGLLFEYVIHEYTQISVKSKARTFDVILANQKGLTDEEMQNAMSGILTEEHLLKEFEDSINNIELRYTLKEMIRLGIMKC